MLMKSCPSLARIQREEAQVEKTWLQVRMILRDAYQAIWTFANEYITTSWRQHGFPPTMLFK